MRVRILLICVVVLASLLAMGAKAYVQKSKVGNYSCFAPTILASVIGFSGLLRRSVAGCYIPPNRG